MNGFDEAFNSYQTKLSPEEERLFLQWYQNVAQENGLSPNPNSPNHHYDYRGFYKAQQQNPIMFSQDERGHFSDTFKTVGHPSYWTRMIPDGMTPEPETMKYWQNMNGLPNGGW